MLAAAALALLAAAAGALLYFKLIHAFKYWDTRGVKGPKPTLFYGNVKTVLTKKDSMGSLVGKIYKQFPDEKVIGIYQGVTPILVVKDPDLVKRIIVKDFPHFTDRGFRLNDEPLSRNLFNLDGDEWRILRQKLTPLFSTGRLKMMMPLLQRSVEEYMRYLDELVEKQVPFEIRELNMKYTLKTITSVAFGLDIDTFTDGDSQFIEMADRLFKPRGFLRVLAVLVDGIIPGIFKKLPIVFASKKISDFFNGLVSEIVRSREGKPKVRKDFMDLMIELKEQGTVKRSGDDATAELKITDEIIVAQALLFYAAGFETSSGAMAFLLYELAHHRDIQDRCYEEIERVANKHGGVMTYEALNELEYVSMAFDEALRKHTVATILLRKCIKDYEIPELDLIIEKGTKLFIPSMALHLDDKYFLEPEKFEPERFAPDKKAGIHGGTYLPFGDGPRNCIGLRFAKVQSLLGVSQFLRRFRVSPCGRSPRALRYDPAALVLKSADGLPLRVHRRDPLTTRADPDEDTSPDRAGTTGLHRYS